MIYKNENGNIREFIYACPNFNLWKQRIELRLIRGNQVKQTDNSWIDIQDSIHEGILITINDDILIDIRTLERANEETPSEYIYPAYTYFMAATPNLLGLTSLNDHIYQAISTQVETYLQANNLI